jgi:hypothetical protein
MGKKSGEFAQRSRAGLWVCNTNYPVDLKIIFFFYTYEPQPIIPKPKPLLKTTKIYEFP